MKFINLASFRYLLTGGLNTCLTYGIYLLSLQFTEYRTAFSISFIVGIFFSYILNAKFVFKVRFTFKDLAGYHLIYLAHYFAGFLLLQFQVDYLNVDPRIAPLINVLIMTPLSFLASKMLFKYVGAPPKHPLARF